MKPDIAKLLEMVPDAVAELNQMLEYEEPRKKGRWRKQTSQDHLKHASGHWSGLCLGDQSEKHILHLQARLFFKRQLEIEKERKNGHV